MIKDDLGQLWNGATIVENIKEGFLYCFRWKTEICKVHAVHACTVCFYAKLFSW